MISLNSILKGNEDDLKEKEEFESKKVTINKKSSFDTSLLRYFIKTDRNASSIKDESFMKPKFPQKYCIPQSNLNKTFDTSLKCREYSEKPPPIKPNKKEVLYQRKRTKSTQGNPSSHNYFKNKEKICLNSSAFFLQPIYENHEDESNFLNDKLKSDENLNESTPIHTPRILGNFESNKKPTSVQFSPIIYTKTRDSNGSVDTPTLDSERWKNYKGNYYHRFNDKSFSHKESEGFNRDSSDSYTVSDYNFPNHKLSTGETDSHRSKNSIKGKGRKRMPDNNKEKYEIIVENVEFDGRTTIMIRNIPNKYNFDMILERINKEFRNTYDFFYLPVDFKVKSFIQNKCNIGFAFLNFTNPISVGEFYQRFHDTKWEFFNSEKICQITYARIQGRENLCQHFEDTHTIQQTDKSHRPLILPPSRLSNIHLLVEKQVQHFKSEKESGRPKKSLNFINLS